MIKLELPTPHSETAFGEPKYLVTHTWLRLYKNSDLELPTVGRGEVGESWVTPKRLHLDELDGDV